MSPTGISAFDFHESSGSFVFTASSSIFQCVDNYDSVRIICSKFD